MYKDDSLTLHTDLYQINMMQVYFNQGIHNKKAVLKFISVNFRLKWLCCIRRSGAYCQLS